jgi:hypothetical protein
MPLEPQTISVNFGQGIDTKTDSKAVVVGDLIRLENGTFTKAKRVAKRNGYTSLSLSIVGGGTLSSPKLLKAFQSETVVADSGRLYSYAPDLAGWVDKGKYLPVGVTSQAVSKGAYLQQFQTGCQLGNIALYSYCAGTAGKTATVTVTDLQSGTVLLSDYSLASDPASGNYAFPKAVLLGSTAMAVVYLNAANHLVMRILTASVSGVTFGSEVTIDNNIALNNVSISSTSIQFDVQNTPTGCVIAYSQAATNLGTPTNIVIKTLNTAGSAVNTATLSAVGRALPLSVSYDTSSSKTWVYWADNATPTAEPVYYAVYDSVLASVLAKTTITTGKSDVTQIVSYSTSSTAQKVYIGFSDTTFIANPVIYSGAVTSTGTVTAPTLLLTNVTIFSKVITYGSGHYLVIYGQDGLFYTGFVIDLADSIAIAKISPLQFGYSFYGYTSTAFTYGSTKVVIPASLIFQSQTVVDTEDGFVFPVTGTSAVTLDFAATEAYQAIQANGSLLLNGGVLSQYDGKSVTEQGFNQSPVIAGADTIATTGGHMPDGTYRYLIVYQWYDASGNLHQSAPSSVYTVDLIGGTSTQKVTLYYNTLSLTQRTTGSSKVQVAIYRTMASGTEYFQITSPLTPVTNDPTVAVSSFVDTYADVSLETGEPVYTAGGIISNDSPPAALVMGVRQNRVYIVPSEAPNTVWYSKTINSANFNTNGDGLSFSGAFYFQTDSVTGAVTGLAEMDEKLILFKDADVLVVTGDGPNNAGGGSSLSPPQPNPSTSGCSTQKSVALTPNGIIRKTAKGFYLLDRSLSDSYIGAKVEAYNSQDVTAVTLTSDINQIRWLTSSGYALVYDYFFNQWSTFTNHTGYSSDVVSGVYTYATTGGKVYQENTTTFLDNATAYALKAQVAWIKLSSLQGFQRVRRLAILGDYANGSSASHQVQASFAYDYGTTFTTPVPYTLGASSGAGVMQYRERLPIQKCESVTMLIEEVTTGASGESVSFTDLALEVGMKRGINKMASSRTVG